MRVERPSQYHGIGVLFVIILHNVMGRWFTGFDDGVILIHGSLPKNLKW
jgi:hypothetical protein